MKFDELDRKMRVFETAHDQVVLPEIYMVARLDGRGFTRLTKEEHPFEKPFDGGFRELMATTTRHLMNSGFKVLYGYAQSDEISLLFDLGENSFGRKIRKVHSVLAGEASACFSVALGAPACFDCRISRLPNAGLVVDYFRWRNEDAARNALNAYCYWTARKQGSTVKEATAFLSGRSVAEKNETLFGMGINFNDLPSWQKRGYGFYWEQYQAEGVNPKTGETVVATRRCIRQELELPKGDAYSAFISAFL